MPWKECHTMDERLRFVARLLEGEKMAPSLVSRASTRNSPEVPFCERSARTGFQVCLEANGVSFSAEFHRHDDGPGPVREGVARGAVVVPVQAAGDVVCNPHVVSRRVGIAPRM